MKRFRCLALVAILAMLPAATLFAGTVRYVTPERPFSKLIGKVTVKPVERGKTLRVPLITWGGDVATIYANGGHKTAPQSIMARQGLSLELFLQDDFVSQVKDYLEGRTPFLRGTLGMINIAAEVLSQDPRTRPVVILQETWSTGGDALVVRSPDIRRVKDLEGKTIVLQQYSPHLDYLDVLLRDAGLTWRDVNVKFVEEITLPPYDTKGSILDPANAMRNDPSVDAVMVISPDALALTSGGKVGTGAEDSVKGARILVSTKTANRVIADVYAVRKDFLDAHRATVEKFVLGYLQGSEGVTKLVEEARSNPAPYREMTKLAAQVIFGSPQLKGEIAGLLSDCTFVGFPGNVDFFLNPHNLQNFENLNRRIQTFLVREGYAKRQVLLTHANWDYDRFKPHLENVAGVELSRFKSQKQAQRIVEKVGDSTVLFAFSIQFEPNQKVFDETRYKADFDRALDLASRYGGAILEIVGHSDPMRVLKLKKEKASPAIIKRTERAAANLSLLRANEVKNAILAYSKKQGIKIDHTQIVTNGKGIADPLYPKPRTREEWLANMRVDFRLLNVEAELSEFEALE